MPTFKLEFSSFRIKKKAKDEYVDVQTALGAVTFTAFFKKFASLFETDIEVNEVIKKTFQFQSNSLKFSKGNRLISGIIQAGEFGTGREITNTLTKKVKGKLLKTDSVTNPFYFFLYFPKDSVIGYLCLQTVGSHGIATVFSDYFRKFFKDNSIGNHTIEFSPLLNKALMMKLIETSAITEINLRRYDIPSETTTKYKVGTLVPHKPIIAEFSLRSTGGFSLFTKNKVKAYIDNPQTMFFDFPALKETGFDELSETSIKIDNGKTERTIVLNHLDRFKTRFDINNDVVLNADGFPTYESTHSIALEIFSESFIPIED